MREPERIDDGISFIAILVDRRVANHLNSAPGESIVELGIIPD